MFIPTHDKIESVDGTSITIYDTTPLQDYVDEGIDITTDIVSIVFELEDNGGNIYSLTISNSDFLNYVRTDTGYNIAAITLGYPDLFFVDGIYISRIIMTEDSTGNDLERISDSEDMFVANIKTIVISQTKDTDWKSVYSPNKYKPFSGIEKRYLLLGIEYASESGMIEEANTLLEALNKICS